MEGGLLTCGDWSLPPFLNWEFSFFNTNLVHLWALYHNTNLLEMYDIRSLIPLIRHLSKICGTLLKIWPHNRKRRHMCLNLKNLFVQIELETIVLHPSYETSDLPSRGFSAASSCCWSDELYVGCTLNWKKVSVSYNTVAIGKCTLKTECWMFRRQP